MAERVNFRSDFSRAMDCHICMGRLDDPKLLSCQHSYCKSCLDNRINFRGDGSGIITCPLECSRTVTIGTTATTGPITTLIPMDKTTNDLPVPSELKGTLDSFNRQSIKHESSMKRLQCAGKHGCANEAAVYCLVCKMLLCPMCLQNHDTSHASFSVQYDRQAKQIKMLCSKHRTMADYFCCDKIICVYCRTRDHMLHRGADTIKEQANKVRELLLDPEYGVGNVKDIIVNTVKNAEATQLSISILRSMLQKTLRNRKLKGLREYLSLVQKEEKRIVDEFDDIVNTQLQLYPKAVSTVFYNNILERADFEIVMSKRDIAQNVAAFSKTIPVLNIGLTDSSTSQPLGDLNVERNDFVTINNRRTCASVSQSSTGFNQVTTGPKHLEKLRYLLNDVIQTIEGICGTQNQQDKQVSPQDNKSPVICSQESPMTTILQSSPPHLSQGGMASSYSSSPLSPSDGKDNLKATISTEKNIAMDAALESTSSFIDIERLESVVSELNRGRGIDCIRDLCKNNNEEIILSILELHPSVASLKNMMGNTLSHFAASFGCTKVLSCLLSMDCNNIDTSNSLGSTPLHYATENCHANCVEMLLSSNCRTDLENVSGYTALALANKLDYAEIIALLQKYVTNNSC